MSNSWFRMYSEVLNDPKVQFLPDDVFKHWVNLLCLACDNNGVIAGDINAIAFALRISPNGALTVLERLLNGGLIEKLTGGSNGYRYAPHGWGKRQYKSDTSTERVKRFRNVSETPRARTDTDTDTDTDKKKEPLRGKKKNMLGKLSKEPRTEYEEKLDQFIEHRQAMKKKMTPQAIKLLKAALNRYHEQGQDVLAMIDQAILRGWQTVYPPKEDQHPDAKYSVRL